MTEIKNYYTKKDLNKVYPVLKELRQSLNKEKFLKLYRKMEKQGYKFIGLEFNGQAICIAGYSINYNFYNEKYIFVYDLVTKNDEQSKGYGKSMLKHLHRIAKNENCTYISLESGISRKDAHRFYTEKMGYEKFCLSFRHKLKN